MPQNTLKTLGFEKTAYSKVDAAGDFVTNFLSNIRKVQKPAEKLLHDTGIWTTTAHQDRLNKVHSYLALRKLRNKKKSEKPFGLKTGIGIGAVGATGLYSIFGDKKRNSPYYPPGY